MLSNTNNYGAIIIRFKYVSRNKSLPPEEKVVSYHVMNFKGKQVLGVHVQGDRIFSMHKQWGHGDERLIPIYPEYANTIIRWGNEEVTKAVLKYNNNTRLVLEKRNSFIKHILNRCRRKRTYFLSCMKISKHVSDLH
jgi:hypothetical protein